MLTEKSVVRVYRIVHTYVNYSIFLNKDVKMCQVGHVFGYSLPVQLFSI